MTGTNIAAAIFFWPGLLATYSNANDAIKAANERKEYLRTLYKDKGCSHGSTTASVIISTNARDYPFFRVF